MPMMGSHSYADAAIPELYRWFADQTSGSSPIWTQLCRTVVVFHTAVLPYLQRERRAEFVDLVQGLPVRWVSNEGERVIASMADRIEPWRGESSFVLALDGEPLARTGPHGQYLHWI